MAGPFDLQPLGVNNAIAQFDQSRALATQRRSRDALSEFGQGALAGDKNALAQLIKSNPEAGLQVAQQLEQQKRADAAAARAAAQQNKLFQFRVSESKRDQANLDRTFAANQAFKTQELGLKIAKLNQVKKPDPQKLFDNTQDLRKEYTALSKDFLKVRDAFGRIESITSSPDQSGIDDTGLIFSFMKMLDPSSTVRESEFATVENAGSVPQTVIQAFNKAKSGEKLAPEIRQQIISQARRLFKQQNGQHVKLTESFEVLAEKAGLDPNDVAIDLGLVPQEQAPTEGVTPGGIKFRFVD